MLAPHIEELDCGDDDFNKRIDREYIECLLKCGVEECEFSFFSPRDVVRISDEAVQMGSVLDVRNRIDYSIQSSGIAKEDVGFVSRRFLGNSLSLGVVDSLSSWDDLVDFVVDQNYLSGEELSERVELWFSTPFDSLKAGDILESLMCPLNAKMKRLKSHYNYCCVQLGYCVRGAANYDSEFAKYPFRELEMMFGSCRPVSEIKKTITATLKVRDDDTVGPYSNEYYSCKLNNYLGGTYYHRILGMTHLLDSFPRNTFFIFPGDGIGIGARVCSQKGFLSLSSDMSHESVAWATRDGFNVVLSEGIQFLDNCKKTGVKGVVVLSHVADYFNGVRWCLENGYDFVSWESKDVYKGHVYAKEVKPVIVGYFNIVSNLDVFLKNYKVFVDPLENTKFDVHLDHLHGKVCVVGSQVLADILDKFYGNVLYIPRGVPLFGYPDFKTYVFPSSFIYSDYYTFLASRNVDVLVMGTQNKDFGELRVFASNIGVATIPDFLVSLGIGLGSLSRFDYLMIPGEEEIYFPPSKKNYSVELRNYKGRKIFVRKGRRYQCLQCGSTMPEECGQCMCFLSDLQLKYSNCIRMVLCYGGEKYLVDRKLLYMFFSESREKVAKYLLSNSSLVGNRILERSRRASKS